MAFLIQEIGAIHPDTGDRYPILTMAWDTDGTFFSTADLIVLAYDAPILGSDARVVYRVKNVNNSQGNIKLEWRGQVSSFQEDLTPNEDGWVEVRINGRVYQDGDDFATIDPTVDPVVCSDGVRGLKMNNVSGWQIGKWLVSAARCLYLSETAAYCREALDSPGGGTTAGNCPPSGPGGSSFDGAPTGQRYVAGGGCDAVYVDPAGGGVPTQEDDVVEPQTMAGITDPIVTFDLTLCDETVHTFAKGYVSRSGRPPALPKLVSIGPIVYPWSDRFGNIRAQTWEVRLADPDGVIRGWLDTGVNRFYKRWHGILSIEDDAKRLAGISPRMMARGRCVSVRIEEEQVVTLAMADEFSRHDSPYSLDRIEPHVLLGDIFGPGTTAAGLTVLSYPPEQVAAAGAQIILGEAGDDYKSRLADIPIGVVRFQLVGDFLIASKTYQGYFVCLYAAKQIRSIFGSNLDPDCPASVRLCVDNVDDTTEILAPGFADFAWPFDNLFIDFVRNGVTYRAMMVFIAGAISNHAVDQKVPISGNVDGIEDVGDCTGDLIDDGAYIIQHLIDQVGLQQKTSGNWGDLTRFPNGDPVVKPSSFALCKARHDERITWPDASIPEVGTDFADVPIQNLNFATDPTVFGPSNWNLADWDVNGGTWNWDGSKAVHNTGVAGSLRLDIYPGSWNIRLGFTLSGCTAGTLSVRLISLTGPTTGPSVVFGPGDNGVHTDVSVAMLTEMALVWTLEFAASSDFDGAIDNLSGTLIFEEGQSSRSGYRGAIVIDERKSLRDWIATLLVSYDMRLGVDHRSQIVAWTRPTSEGVDPMPTYSDSRHIREGSFEIAGELNAELENSLAYEAGYAPASGRPLVARRTLDIPQAIEDWGDTYKAQDVTFSGIYRPELAADVAGRRLALTENGITPCQVTLGLHAGDLRQGDLVRLTHYAGLGVTGWLERICRVTDRVINADDESLSVVVSLEDQQYSWTLRVGFHPVGNAGDDTAFIIGDAADGTAWRVG